MAATGGTALPGFSITTTVRFSAAFDEPTIAQAEASDSIGRGDNTLVIAPTGSGKTSAAFLGRSTSWLPSSFPPIPSAAAGCCVSHR
jgi:ATP-dependent helicase Lhr and Lhr-like helicase